MSCVRSFPVMLLWCLLFDSAAAQKIVYSDYDKDDTRRMNFEIIGKVNDYFLIYKSIRSTQKIAILDNDMKQVALANLNFVPDNDRMINVDFYPYSDFVYMIYQYQRKNIVYCMAVKLDGMGKKMAEVIQLDTTQISFAASNKIYTTLSSEDKSRIMVMKINSRNRRNYIISTLLFDNNLQLLKSSRLSMPMEERNDFLSEFSLDNDGDLVFAKFNRSSNDNIGKAAVIVKYAQVDTFTVQELNIEKTYLDEMRIKVDNFNKRYLITSFLYKQRRSNIDGFYFYIWEKGSSNPAVESSIFFTDELKREARGEANMKMAFNNYFIRNIIIRKDGGFIIGSESYYTTSRFNNWNRWNYIYGAPYYSPLDYYYYYPSYGSSWGFSRWRSNQSVRYNADNITIFSFTRDGNLEWTNVINKSQFSDESDDLISYYLMNTGNALHFLFTDLEKRTKLLTDISISPDGQLNQNPTLKNLDRGYEFMPKYAKQVSAKQMIIPCLYRSNFICFAKIDYNL
jgi:hypothetical protein